MGVMVKVHPRAQINCGRYTPNIDPDHVVGKSTVCGADEDVEDTQLKNESWSLECRSFLQNEPI